MDPVISIKSYTGVGPLCNGIGKHKGPPCCSQSLLLLHWVDFILMLKSVTSKTV